MPVTKEGDNLVIEGLVEHGVYPTKHDEIDASVVLRGAYEVRGAIYGRSLIASGKGTVHGPIVTAEDLYIDQSASVDYNSSFLSGLVAPKIIRNVTPAYEVGQTCVTALDNARLRIRGPVVSDTVHLSNAVVIGNIHAQNVRLDACVVFGIIDCDSLVLNTCNFVAYRANRARLMGRLSTWMGFGVSDDGLDFLSRSPRPMLEAGEDGTRPADLRFIPVCMSGTVCDNQEDAETCDRFHQGTCPASKSGNALGRLNPRVSLGDVDFRFQVIDEVPTEEPLRFRFATGSLQEIAPTRDSLEDLLLTMRVPPEEIEARHPDEGRWQLLADSEAFRRRYKVRRVLTVAGRILNAEPIQKQIEEITNLGRDIAHWPYYDSLERNRVLEHQLPRRGARELLQMGLAQADVRTEA